MFGGGQMSYILYAAGRLTRLEPCLLGHPISKQDTTKYRKMSLDAKGDEHDLSFGVSDTDVRIVLV